KSHMFVRPESAPSRSDPRPAGVRRSAVDEESAGATEPVTIDPRIKEIYRRLVRRLHPDLRADGDASVSSLWHEVQEAYVAGDVEGDWLKVESWMKELKLGTEETSPGSTSPEIELRQ